VDGRAFRDKGVDVKLCREASLHFGAIIFRDCHLTRSLYILIPPPQLLSLSLSGNRGICRGEIGLSVRSALPIIHVLRARRMDIWPTIWNGP